MADDAPSAPPPPNDAPATSPPPPAAGPSEPAAAPHQADAGPEDDGTTTAAPSPPHPDDPLDDDALLASFFADVKAADREGEVNRVLGAFKLNPYEQLGVRFDVEDAEIARAYRKASLLVHPDKCAHPRAADAFDMLGAAVMALRDAEKRDELDGVLRHVRGKVVAEHAKTAKRDGVAALAAALKGGGADGAAAVQAEWEASSAFHAAWRDAARDALARLEFRHRKLTLRIKETEERLEEEDKAARKKARTDAKADRAWDKARGKRVGSWRAFQQRAGGGTGAAVKGAATVKPPKAAVVDAERTYVRRPAGPPPGEGKL